MTKAKEVDLVEILSDPLENPKSFTELLQAGTLHKGGLAQLAAAEKTAGKTPTARTSTSRRRTR
jgi:hypothetical protein